MTTLGEDEPRARLLAAAWCRFAERGYVATSMDDLVTDLGMSKRTIYELVRDKEALVLEAALVQLDAFDRRAEAILGSDASARTRFRKLVALAIEAYRAAGPALVHELPRRAPTAWREIRRRRDELVQRHLERAVADRTTRWPAAAAVRATAGAISGLLASREAGDAPGAVEEDVETLTDVLADGLFGPPREDDPQR